MTINSALLAGVTGLTANASALAAISENIANANTIGYKEVGVNFADLVNSGGGGSYSAGGLTASTVNLISQQGTITASSSATDLAISGGGFFVTTGTPGGVAAGDGLLFTRAGSFNVDKDGYLENSAGLFLQGWPTDSAGNVISGAGADSLSSINLLQYANSAQASSNASLSANLDASSAGEDLSTYSTSAPTPNDMAQYALNPSTGIKPDFSVQVPVYDSKGGTHNLMVDFVKNSDPTKPNTWTAEVRADPPSDIAASLDGSSPSDGLIATGTVTFNADGTINTDPSLTTLPTNILMGASDGSTTGSNANWTSGLGIASQSIKLDLSGLTQLSGSSTVNKVSVDGTPFGSLSGVSVDASGNVTAVFANGSTRKIAQVAIATFTNPDGLTSTSGDSFTQSGASGAFSLKAAGTGGAGQISPSSLESSTVDLSTEFTGLIVTQRAYTACSKIITTADQMLEQLLTIKQ